MRDLGLNINTNNQVSVSGTTMVKIFLLSMLIFAGFFLMKNVLSPGAAR